MPGSILGATAPLSQMTANYSTPLKPILKTSSILGSRRSSEDAGLDDGDMDGSQSPRKRQKVEFDLDGIQIREIGARTPEEIKKEIRKALDGHARGDDEDYDVLKEVLSGKERFYDDDDDDDADPALPEKRRQELKVYLVALATFAPLLGRSNNGIVKSVLQCEWLGRDEQFAKVYIQFIAALVTAQGSYLGQVLTMIIGRFSDSRSRDWSIRGFPEVSHTQMQERLHLALSYLLQVFPAAKDVAAQLVTAKYPFNEDPKRMHLAYVDNLLKMRQYAPELRSQIMDLIVSRLVQIDVQMQMDLDDLDDSLTAMVAMALKASQTASEREDEDVDDSDNESVSSDDTDTDELNKIKAVRENIEKMDSVLNSLFELYTPRFANPQSDEAVQVFEGLLAEFSNIILPTYKSRHTQFLIFHFAQRSETLMDAFCGTCINIAFESQRPLILRQAAAAYLASFVARGAMVPGHIVRTIFEVLGYHLDQMRAVYQETCRGPDVRRYAPFYALTQALLYIFCFRWRDLIRSVPENVDRDDPASYLDQEIEWESGIREILRRNIHTPMNPLKVCSPAIVEQFAKLSQRLGFLYVYSVIESNKRMRLSQFASGAYLAGGSLRESGFDLSDESWQQLDSYFPFDPYQLPTSKKWVEQDYLQWQPIPGLNPEDRDESDDDEEGAEDEDEDIEEGTATDNDSEEDD